MQDGEQAQERGIAILRLRLCCCVFFHGKILPMNKPKLYLDNCCFNRPFDDQSQLIVRLETEAKLFIQEGIKDGTFELVWSYIVDEENADNPFPLQKKWVKSWKAFAIQDMEVSDDILHWANHFGSKGIKSMDALHLACAKVAGVDGFITTDLGILKKRLADIQVLNPLDFVQITREAHTHD
jgi:hypothetical protein